MTELIALLLLLRGAADGAMGRGQYDLARDLLRVANELMDIMEKHRNGTPLR